MFWWLGFGEREGEVCVFGHYGARTQAMGTRGLFPADEM